MNATARRHWTRVRRRAVAGGSAACYVCLVLLLSFLRQPADDLSSQEPDAVWNGCAVEMAGAAGDVLGLAFSPDGTMLAAGSRDGTVRLWNPVTGENTASLRGHTAPVSALAFSPDGTALTTGSWDEASLLWDTATGRITRTLGGPAFTRLAPYREDDPHTHVFTAMAVSADGGMLATGTGEGTIRLLDPATGSDEASLFPNLPHSRLVLSAPNSHNGLAFSPDGTLLAAGSRDGTVRLWDLASNEAIAAIVQAHVNADPVVAFSPDGTMLAIGWNGGGRILLWSPTTQKVMSTLRGHVELLLAMVFDPGGATLATASENGTVRLWNPTTGENTSFSLGDRVHLQAAAFSRDGTMLATGAADGKVRVWNRERCQASSKK